MSEKHKIDTDGILEDGVRTAPVTPVDMMQYSQAQQALSQWTTPVLLHANSAHERLAVINVDGTGNDMINDPEHITNIGFFNKELETLSKANPRIHAIYEVGPGTQRNVVKKTVDGMLGHTYDAHLEHAYEQFIEQAAKWLKEDPQAQIRVAITGFSRGGDGAAGLARLIHERGIQDPRGMVVRHHFIGPDTTIYTKPPLVPLGKIMQAVVLLDPVGTGVPHRRDRQLPPSVVSGLQITARDERRDAFPSSEIIPNGLSADGRFLQLTLPGAHTNIGGGYHRNGLSTLNFNLAVDYLNALSDTPLLHKQALPPDPNMYVIHHSEDHLPIYTTRYVTQHGERGLRGAQQGAPDCRATIACLPPEPLDPALAAALPERHLVTPGPVPAATVSPLQQGVSSSLDAASIDDAQHRHLDAAVHDIVAAPTLVAFERRDAEGQHDRSLSHALEATMPSDSLCRDTTYLQGMPHYSYETVSTLHRDLNQLQITDNQGRLLVESGVYGEHTCHAVAVFQQQHTLPATGLADAATLQAITTATALQEPATARDAQARVTPSTREETSNAPESDLSQRLDRMLKAADISNWVSFRKDTQAFADMAPGRELFAQTKMMVDMQELHATQLAERRQAMEQQMQMQTQHSQQRSHGISR
ncbi:MAG TPA: DUF2235 domain-containing protein [Candidatus Saccharimonadales bacterium]|nr:DUF2235 domain-containing protein [Candidatus Saccharimonadales bacterium]